MGICQSTPVRGVTAPEATTEASGTKAAAAPSSDLVEEVPLTVEAVQISEKAVVVVTPALYASIPCLEEIFVSRRGDGRRLNNNNRPNPHPQP